MHYDNIRLLGSILNGFDDFRIIPCAVLAVQQTETVLRFVVVPDKALDAVLLGLDAHVFVGAFRNHATLAEVFSFLFTQPVSSMMTGMPLLTKVSSRYWNMVSSSCLSASLPQSARVSSGPQKFHGA